MYKKTKYCCDICASEYDTEKDANICEQLGYPEETADIKVGDSITFTKELPINDGGGVADPTVTYKLYPGKVLYKYCLYNRRTDSHDEVLLVSFEEEQPNGEEIPMECQVIMRNFEGEGFKLFSPYQMGKFKPGFTESFKKRRESLKEENNE